MFEEANIKLYFYSSICTCTYSNSDQNAKIKSQKFVTIQKDINVEALKTYNL